MSNEGKKVIVPQHDLDRLEQARLDLWELIAKHPTHIIVNYMGISGAMWRLAHRKYPVFKEDS